MSPQSTADAYIRQPSLTDAAKPQARGPASRWHVSTPAGQRWQERRALGRCLSPDCDRPRYQSPGGWVNTRCRECGADYARERRQARHPGSRTYRHRSPGIGALADAVNAE
jgi:hypothetical protein